VDLSVVEEGGVRVVEGRPNHSFMSGVDGAENFSTSGAFYVVAVVRVAFGLVLIAVASASRARKALRVLGYIIVIAGITTALMGLLGIGRARAMIEWWLQQGSSVVRLTGVLILALGGFVAYACAPAPRVD
jgi:hypothetical protein